MPDTSHSPANDSIESANQREKAAAVLLKELDERQDSVLQELEQLNLDVEGLIESWQGKKKEELEEERLETEHLEERIA